MRKLPWWVWLIGGAAMLGGGAVTIRLVDIANDRSKFCTKLFEVVSKALPFLSVRARVLVVAQAAMESGWGSLTNSRDVSNNVFNITAGQSWLRANKPTVGGTDHDAAGKVIGQTWRAYENLDSAVNDYWSFLSGGYSNAASILRSAFPNVTDFVWALGSGEYGSYFAAGTASVYAATLNSTFASVGAYLNIDVTGN